MKVEAEVVIAGGGPAGSVIGMRLAELGHDVVLIEKHPFPRDRIGESLPPSINPLLDFIGVREAINAAGFLPTRGAWIRWAAPLQFRETPDSGYQVTRAQFDAILLDAARERGVRILQPARFDPDQVKARLIVDATGRGCATGGAKRITAPRTLARYAYWDGKPWPDSCSRVEALEEAWIWAAPLRNGRSVIAVFTDPAMQAGYDDWIAAAQWIPGGGCRGPIQACDATPWRSEVMAAPGLIRVGEAAFTIDPLSSQGVQTAIASALQAAVVAHTMLLRPEDAALAIAFYQARQEAAAARHAAIAADLYAAGAKLFPTAFWRCRASVAPAPEPPPPARITGDFVEQD